MDLQFCGAMVRCLRIWATSWHVANTVAAKRESQEGDEEEKEDDGDEDDEDSFPNLRRDKDLGSTELELNV